MTAGPALTTVETCLTRAVAIKETAEHLWTVDEEWFAVCYFYAAYHMVKAAFIEDPIFDDIARVTAKSSRLTLGDRYATSHNGRVIDGVRTMGVNDIVVALYPSIAAEYVRLHMASINVRYSNGLGAIAKQSVRDDYNVVANAYQSGHLRTSL